MECEQACDDQVLQQEIEASDYASHLLELSTFVRFESKTLPLAMAIATRPSVEFSIASILSETQNRRGVTTARVLAMFAAVLIGVALLASTATRVAYEELTQEDSELVVADENKETVESEDYVDDGELIEPLLDKKQAANLADSAPTIRKEDHEKLWYHDLSLDECIAHAIMNL